MKKDSNVQQKHLHSVMSNNNHLFTKIATTIEANQGSRSILKTLSNVFHIHNLPFSNMWQDKLQEFWI